MTKTKSVPTPHPMDTPSLDDQALDALARKISDYVAIAINHEVYRLEQSAPYRQQYTLEKVIEYLRAKV